MKKYFFLFAFLTGFLFNYSSAQTDVQVNFGEPIDLIKDERVSFGQNELNIMVAELIEDSRCPAGVNCIWEGQIKFRLNIQNKGKEISKIITIRGGKTESVEIDGYVITVLEVNAKSTLGLKRYTYTLEVTKQLKMKN